MIEYIKDADKILAIVIRSNYSIEGIEFFSSKNDSQQLGFMKRPSGYNIAPHCHNIIQREVHITQEVLFIRNGNVRVDFYNDDKNYLNSIVLNPLDVILLVSGGHGFKFLTDSEVIEVKQGPYDGAIDKVRFDAVSDDLIRLL
jgi:hypothetical protein